MAYNRCPNSPGDRANSPRSHSPCCSAYPESQANGIPQHSGSSCHAAEPTPPFCRQPHDTTNGVLPLTSGALGCFRFETNPDKLTVNICAQSYECMFSFLLGECLGEEQLALVVRDIHPLRNWPTVSQSVSCFFYCCYCCQYYFFSFF